MGLRPTSGDEKLEPAGTVGHSILVTCYYLLTRGTTDQDLGETYFAQCDHHNVVRRSVHQLQGEEARNEPR